jgi:hypothetical protein
MYLTICYFLPFWTHFLPFWTHFFAILSIVYAILDIFDPTPEIVKSWMLSSKMMINLVRNHERHSFSSFKISWQFYTYFPIFDCFLYIFTVLVTFWHILCLCHLFINLLIFAVLDTFFAILSIVYAILDIFDPTPEILRSWILSLKIMINLVRNYERHYFSSFKIFLQFYTYFHIFDCFWYIYTVLVTFWHILCLCHLFNNLVIFAVLDTLLPFWAFFAIWDIFHLIFLILRQRFLGSGCCHQKWW